MTVGRLRMGWNSVDHAESFTGSWDPALETLQVSDLQNKYYHADVLSTLS